MHLSSKVETTLFTFRPESLENQPEPSILSWFGYSLNRRFRKTARQFERPALICSLLEGSRSKHPFPCLCSSLCLSSSSSSSSSFSDLHCSLTLRFSRIFCFACFIPAGGSRPLLGRNSRVCRNKVSDLPKGVLNATSSKSLEKFMSPVFHWVRPLLNLLAKNDISCFSRRLHTQQLFDEILHTDLYSLNALLTSHVRYGDYFTAWSLFRCMHCACSGLNAYTFAPILTACSAFLGSEWGKQIHGLMIKLGAESGTVAKTAVMNMYSKCGYLDDSVRVFEEMEFKDVVSWNALLSSFLRQGLARKALSVFEAMRMEGVEFSEFTLCSVIKACALLKAFQQGKQVHGVVVVMGRDMVFLGTALIDFYSSQGNLSAAMRVYSSLNDTNDEALNNSLISGCIKNRKYLEAFSIISARKPNVIVLTSALAACSDNIELWIGKQIHCVAVRHCFTSNTQLCNVLLDMYAKCGQILNARCLFDRIFRKDVVSWTSMIDAYGSHGNGFEAFELFKLMNESSRVSPNSVTILAVLSACGHSGLVEKGRECFNLAKEKYWFHLGPEHYVCFIDILGRAGLIDEMWHLFDEKAIPRRNVAVWAALLNACIHNVDFTRGELAAKNLLELEPDNPEIYVLLSNFYALAGKWGAVEELRSIMREKELVKGAGSSWVTVSACHKDDICK